MSTDRRSPRRLAPVALVLLVALTGGCTSLELTRVRNDLARQLPEAKIGKGYSLSFGRFTLGLGRLFVGLGDDEDSEAVGLALREVRRVQVGHYEVDGLVDGNRLVMPARLRHYVEDEGWVHLATFRDDGEAGWVLYRERGDAITDLFAVVLSDDELVLTRISGDLSALVVNLLQHERTKLPLFQDEPPAEESEATQALLRAAAEIAG